MPEQNYAETFASMQGSIPAPTDPQMKLQDEAEELDPEKKKDLAALAYQNAHRIAPPPAITVVTEGTALIKDAMGSTIMLTIAAERCMVSEGTDIRDARAFVATALATEERSKSPNPGNIGFFRSWIALYDQGKYLPREVEPEGLGEYTG